MSVARVFTRQLNQKTGAVPRPYAANERCGALCAGVQDPEARHVPGAVGSLHLAQDFHSLVLAPGVQQRLAVAQLRVLGTLEPALPDAGLDALKACHLAQTRWVQATSRRPEGVDGYKIDFAQDQDAFVDTAWPTRSKDELLEVTFTEANIDHDRHPGLLRLIGAKQDLT